MRQARPFEERDLNKDRMLALLRGRKHLSKIPRKTITYYTGDRFPGFDKTVHERTLK